MNAALLEELLLVPASERDTWVDLLLGLEEAPPDESGLPRGAVPYLPCGVAEILAMIPFVRPTDAFVDVGSGVGRVVLLTHLLTGVRALGVEIQSTLVAIARERSAAFPKVSFTHADASKIELEGTFFFLYAPFNGDLQRSVLARIEAVARRHPITVCTVDLELKVPWLVSRPGMPEAIELYDSC